MAAHADLDVALEGAFFIEGEPADAGFDGFGGGGGFGFLEDGLLLVADEARRELVLVGEQAIGHVVVAGAEDAPLVAETDGDEVVVHEEPAAGIFDL